MASARQGSLDESSASNVSNDRTPLLSQKNLFRSLTGRSINPDVSTSGNLDSEEQGEPRPVQNARNLETFSGVFAPVCLSMFSALLFLRVGFIVGQAGLLEVIALFILAYIILACTVLSICAISTNGAIEGGGAYYMISRTLGPEFGGSIGTLFFFANIFSCALYVTGCVEGFIDNFGPGGFLVGAGEGIPSGRWWAFLYASVVALFNLFVCLIGAAMFARTSTIIFFVVMICTFSAIVSFLAQNDVIQVPIPDANTYVGNITYANYTGFSWETFQENVWSHYSLDYTTGSIMNFASVFGVLFSGVTGIMAGANMSGELKEPSKSIPLGTLSAVAFTFVIYILLSFFTAGTCSNFLLLNNYIYMQYINLTSFFIPIGIFAATLSASLSNLIGASRVLIAVAKDELFGIVLAPIAKGVWKDNPYAAVILSWFLVQIILIIGSLNLIAQVTSVFFLLSYCATNLACLGLELTSAPNFRPSFKYVSWYTCFIGLLGTITMMFVINAAYAGICLVICLLLVIVLHLRALPTQWGSISQALIFHQVRKYLLMLDSRKEHVKFWRPQLLLMVSNPRSCTPLIDFANDLKKSGLYVLGHVQLEDLDSWEVDPIAKENLTWLSLVDHLKVKAFVELTVAPTVREGMRQLIRIAGLGAMKPNTIIFGFYDTSPQIDFLKREQANSGIAQPVSTELGQISQFHTFAELRQDSHSKDLAPEEYVGMIQDAIKMRKNVCICRYFDHFDKSSIIKSNKKKFIDVWPVNAFDPSSMDYSDTTTLFLLQMACILHMVPGWKSKTVLRIFMCNLTTDDDTVRREKQLRLMLKQLRINAVINRAHWDDVYSVYSSNSLPDNSQYMPASLINNLTTECMNSFNQLIKRYSRDAAVIFTYLPVPPKEVQANSKYLNLLDSLTEGFPPTVLIYGVSPVISTTL